MKTAIKTPTTAIPASYSQQMAKPHANPPANTRTLSLQTGHSGLAHCCPTRNNHKAADTKPAANPCENRTVEYGKTAEPNATTSALSKAEPEGRKASSHK